MKLKDLIASKSNDYSRIEERFEREVRESLLSDEDTKRLDLVTEPLSIILPSYMVHEQLPLTLEHLNKQFYKNFEVIVVDDNSNPPLSQVIKDQEINFPMKYVWIPYNRNNDPGHARNIGLICSDSDNIIGLDSDIIVQPSLTANLAIKLQYTNGCVFVGFRENVADRKETQRPADISGDWRHSVTIDNHSFMYININDPKEVVEGSLHILEETDYFKNFGFGESLGYWDLTSMVVGHCMAFSKEKAIEVGGFPEFFIGWGLEDISFGANMIADGQYVIPSLNTINFHIIHRTKEDFEGKCLTQFKENIKRYFSYADSSFDPCFPRYNIKSCGKEDNKEFLEVSEK